MSLRNKIRFSVFGAFLLTMLALLAVSFEIVIQRFQLIENDAIREDVSRVQSEIQEDLTDGLDQTAGDWAFWDDTYKYMQDRDPAFISSNMTSTAMNQIGLNVVALIGSDGELVYLKSYDLDTGTDAPAPPGLLNLLQPGSLLTDCPRAGVCQAGIINLPDGPFVVSTWPILTSNAEGPSRGTLVFGYTLDPARMLSMAESTGLNVTFFSPVQGNLPGEAAQALADLMRGSPTPARASGPDLISGFGLIRDLYGEPALLLRVREPRALYQQGLATIGYFALAILLITLVSAELVQRLVNRATQRKQEADEAEGRYRAVVEGAAEAIVVVDAVNLQVLEVNSAFVRMFGFAPRQVVSHSLTDFHLAPAEELDAWLEGIEGNDNLEVTSTTWTRPDGRLLDLEVTAGRIQLDGRDGLSIMIRDVTDRKRAEMALRESEERYALAARGANDGLWDWDLKQDCIYYSPRWKHMLGLGEAEVGDSPKDWFNRVHPDDAPGLQRAIQAHLAGTLPQLQHEHRIRHRDGSYLWVMCRGLAVQNGAPQPARMAGSMTDITARKQAEERLIHDAVTDSLTGLPNRVLFLDRLERTISRTRRHPGLSFAVLFLDLDRFKLVNDSLGHLQGDDMLRVVAKRLAGAVRMQDTVARFGGDEFALLFEDAGDPADVTRVAERLQRILSAPMRIAGQEVFTEASIGIALYTGSYQTGEEVLRDADAAMYRAKQRGRGRFEMFDVGMHERAVNLLQVETDLRRALQRGELRLAYQPIIDLQDGRVRGFEALVRWQHPGRGLLPPSEFLPVAEDSGMMVDIDLWVLHEATAQASRWFAAQPTGQAPVISVNISNQTFTQIDLVDTIRSVLGDSGLPAGQLVIEITETVIISNADEAERMLVRLRDLGVQVALDDFGTGYSSLSYIHRLPLDTLKIDRSFVNGLEAEAGDAAIVRAMVPLAHDLKMKVVAEGVETTEQESRLRDLGCEFGQGFLFAKPLDPDAATALLVADGRPQPAV